MTRRGGALLRLGHDDYGKRRSRGADRVVRRHEGRGAAVARWHAGRLVRSLLRSGWQWRQVLGVGCAVASCGGAGGGGNGSLG